MGAFYLAALLSICLLGVKILLSPGGISMSEEARTKTKTKERE